MPPAWLASWALSTWEPLPPLAEVMVPELVREPPLTARVTVRAPQQPGAVMTTLPWLVRPAVAVRVEEPEPELLSPWTVRVPLLPVVRLALAVEPVAEVRTVMAPSFWMGALKATVVRFMAPVLPLVRVLAPLTVVVLGAEVWLFVLGALTLTVTPERLSVPEPAKAAPEPK